MGLLIAVATYLLIGVIVALWSWRRVHVFFADKHPIVVAVVFVQTVLFWIPLLASIVRDSEG